MISGSLQIKKNTYYAVVNIIDEFGMKKQKWISTSIKADGNNKRLANQRLREIITELETNQISYSKEILFTDWIDKWMEQKTITLRTSTLESYSMNLNKHIMPHFKPLKLSLQKITAQHIQEYYSKKLKEGLSPNSVHRHNTIIRSALADAFKKSIIAFNPVERVTLPKKKKFVGKALSPSQANQLLKAVEDKPVKPAIILGLYYGLRRSEVLGLRWQDINFEEGILNISNTVVRVLTRVEAEQTKSVASKRTLFLVPETKAYLLKLRREQQANKLLFGSSYNHSDNICKWPDGKPFSHTYLSNSLTAALKKCGLPHIRFHDLRHTSGSLLLNKGLSAKQIQEFLGHEQVSTTLDIYGHLSIESKKEVVYALGELLEIGEI